MGEGENRSSAAGAGPFGEYPTLQPCETCQSEGRILRSKGGPDDIDCGECPVCEGTGGEIIETEPVTEEEIMLP